ncbi:class I SAM-dependent methyltransferase [Nocardioides insulae]|uniref:class I SAM-dependent methyltransferase n=1 Tax=Nocardioides insulae TaxID=394734 RepID=UPI000414A5C3|nr:class I SAM-dependent methyltransferase [Nocardioides insulae]
MGLEVSGVPETMLWTLHNRASEALRDDGVIRDPECLRVYRGIEYDYEARFGNASPSHGVRSRVVDAEIRRFAATHPRPTIVNLGEGLETQRYRLADLEVRWMSVDVAEALAVRERLIPPDDTHVHLAASALDAAWADAVPEGPVHVTAQGLLMYFEEQEVDGLIRMLAARFPGAWLSFDTIPEWLSRRSMHGWKLTPSYTVPRMPFGISRRELPAKMARLVPGSVTREIPYSFPRGAGRWLAPLLSATPVLGSHTPSIWTVELPTRP